jgi:uncharacterized membrane protein
MIEVGIILLFILNIYIAKKTKKLDLLIIATVFAAFFENLHVIIFQNYMGGYYYNTQFLLNLYKVPLFVILAWGIIILNAYLIATKLTNKVAKLFLIPILVVMVDFALEFFAVKKGYWVWIGYDAGQGLFGVPASNFISWMLITIALVFCYEELKEKWIVPIAAYILFVFMATAQNAVAGMLGLDFNEQVWLVFLLIALFATMTLVLWKIKPKEEVELRYLTLAVISTLMFYIFSAVMLLTETGFAKEIWPILTYVYLIELVVIIALNYDRIKNKRFFFKKS